MLAHKTEQKILAYTLVLLGIFVWLDSSLNSLEDNLPEDRKKQVMIEKSQRWLLQFFAWANWWWKCQFLKCRRLEDAHCREEANASFYVIFLRSQLCMKVPDGSAVKSSSARDSGDASSISGSGRTPGEGNGNPPQYSCLKNPMDHRAWGLQSLGSQKFRHDWAWDWCMKVNT